MKTFYIAVESSDGGGCSTLSNALAKEIGATRVVEPANDYIGILLRSHLKGAFNFPARYEDEIRAHLFIASRLAMQNEITEHLRTGHVVSDRSLLSTYVYQHGVEWLDVTHRDVRPPDLMVLINTPPDVSFQRLHSRPHLEAFEDLESIRRHHKRYMGYAVDPPAPLADSE